MFDSSKDKNEMAWKLIWKVIKCRDVMSLSMSSGRNVITEVNLLSMKCFNVCTKFEKYIAVYNKYYLAIPKEEESGCREEVLSIESYKLSSP